MVGFKGVVREHPDEQNCLYTRMETPAYMKVIFQLRAVKECA